MSKKENPIFPQEGSRFSFPSDFIFGVAPGAPHQVEGSPPPTDWLALEKRGEAKGEIADPACRWWDPSLRRFLKDMGLANKLEVSHIRLGIEMARVLPEPGKYSKEAVTRYKEMLRIVKAEGLKPVLTLFHYTLPEWLAKQGGWENRKIVETFSQYAKIIAGELGEEVPYWLTINEPIPALTAGWLTGTFPPNKRFPKGIPGVISAFFNMTQAHKRAYQEIKTAHPASQIGIPNPVRQLEPKDRRQLDQQAATRLYRFALQEFIFTRIRKESDFIGLNFFKGNLVSGITRKLPFIKLDNPRDLVSDFGWPITPEFLPKAILAMHKTFNKPIIITENGLSDAADKWRSLYILTHLLAIHQAAKQGADVRGYIHWSLVDNFEWLEGYGQRFGLVGIDFSTQERVARKSYFLYQKICQSRMIDVEALSKEFLSEAEQKILEEILPQLVI